ncbi:lipopolysaccharide heptosyltransferase family protein [Robertkochia solimangrovi]|nr:lipopolysaccharide heptosyltransferase family protein [Robertkochia solimangrovi]
MIGDVLTSTILCHNIKAQLPDAQIDYMIHTHTVAVAQHNPYIDNLLLFDAALRKNKKALISYIRKLNKTQYDVIIDVYGKLETNLITLLCDASKKIAYHKWYSSFLYTNTIKRHPKSITGEALTIEHRLRLLEPLFPEKPLNTYHVRPQIYLSQEEKDWAAAYLTEHGIDDQQLIMIGILGSGPKKNYPPLYMAQLLDILADESEAVLLLNYIPSQKEEVENILNRCHPKTLQKLRPELFAPSLRKFLALLSNCKALIGNEGGAVNMAKALNVPTFSIFSPWIPKEEWSLFEDHMNQSVHLKEYHPELFEGQKTADLKKHSRQLYDHFVPELFHSKLSGYLRELKDQVPEENSKTEEF